MNRIIYLDAAASCLKPESVIMAQVDFLRNHYANAGRGVCARSANVDKMVAAARGRVAKFINACPEQIVFTGGTTDGMNRITKILDDRFAHFIDGKKIAVSDLDHHSARMPFEELWNIKDCKAVLCPLDDDFNLDASNMPVADVFIITAMSNVLGVPQNVAALISAAKKQNPNIITIVDAAQYVAHAPIDVTEWDCDFLCFSAHKIGADTGLGIMYIKEPKEWWPDKFGGGMVSRITGSASDGRNKWKFTDAPEKFEAGTLPLTQIAGLVPAIDAMEKTRGDHTLIRYLYDELSKVDKIKIITEPNAVVLTFVVDGMHVLDFGALIGAHNVCLRVGNRCASWLHRLLGYDGTIRISCGAWNTMDEMKQVVQTIKTLMQ